MYAQAIAPTTPVATPSPRDARPIARWLLACAAITFCMIVLGGVTRLTHSGLSIVEWEPVVGIVPPLTEAGWEAAFEKYKAFPEYQVVNQGMSLAGFKRIYYFEWAHRALGRLIGVAFLLPLAWFLLRRRIDAKLGARLFGLFVLGGLQGVLGWYMVQSGLVDMPRVSQYRLTAHLGLAVVLYGAMIWVALETLHPRRGKVAPWAWAAVGVVFLMILSGGFVAGTRAGLMFTSFPLMSGWIVPPGVYGTDPAWLAAFEDMATIQFNHRMLAWFLVVAIPAGAALAWPRASAPLRRALAVLLIVLGLQFCAGVATLLMRVPVSLAAAHQAGAMLLFAAAICVAQASGRRERGSGA